MTDDGELLGTLILPVDYGDRRQIPAAEATLEMFDGDQGYLYHVDGEFWFYEWCSSSSEGIRVELVMKGWATKLDGVRHLHVGFDKECGRGYLFYPDLPRLSRVLARLHELFPENY
jgi:hypothetical protein